MRLRDLPDPEYLSFDQLIDLAHQQQAEITALRATLPRPPRAPRDARLTAREARIFDALSDAHGSPVSLADLAAAVGLPPISTPQVRGLVAQLRGKAAARGLEIITLRGAGYALAGAGGTVA